MTTVGPRDLNVLVQSLAGMRLKFNDIIRILFNRASKPDSSESYSCTPLTFQARNLVQTTNVIQTTSKRESRLICNLAAKSSIIGSPLDGLQDDFVSIANVADFAVNYLTVKENLGLIFSVLQFQSRAMCNFPKALDSATKVLNVPKSQLDAPLGQVDPLLYRRLAAVLGASALSAALIIDLDELAITESPELLHQLSVLIGDRRRLFVTRNPKTLEAIREAKLECRIHQFGLPIDNDSDLTGLDIESRNFDDYLAEEFAEVDLPLEPQRSESASDPVPMSVDRFKDVDAKMSCSFVTINGEAVEDVRASSSSTFPIVDISTLKSGFLTFGLEFDEVPQDAELVLVTNSASGIRHEVVLGVNFTIDLRGHLVLIDINVPLDRLENDSLGFGFYLRHATDHKIIGKRLKTLLLTNRPRTTTSGSPDITQSISFRLERTRDL